MIAPRRIQETFLEHIRFLQIRNSTIVCLDVWSLGILDIWSFESLAYLIYFFFEISELLIFWSEYLKGYALCRRPLLSSQSVIQGLRFLHFDFQSRNHGWFWNLCILTFGIENFQMCFFWGAFSYLKFHLAEHADVWKFGFQVM